MMMVLALIWGVSRIGVGKLRFLPSQGPKIIHRDIKCDNVFVDSGGKEVKIGDFGLAVCVMEGDFVKEKDTTGTLEYMAPGGLRVGVRVIVKLYDFLVMDPNHGNKPLEKMHGKNAYNRPTLAWPFLDPAYNESLVCHLVRHDALQCLLLLKQILYCLTISYLAGQAVSKFYGTNMLMEAAVCSLVIEVRTRYQEKAYQELHMQEMEEVPSYSSWQTL
ncbi:hypothetical protein CQW23_31588 [Capsicum baccatum]|uniref:non-specific serine/threonine protein kinase n=1 Tax=Capsicum baccatum TaxID=33114 RepID=A0A2G2V7C3_CAPBA|nr:hypothetical protein CQW23_31588 [Capsicum baccatum]